MDRHIDLFVYAGYAITRFILFVLFHCLWFAAQMGDYVFYKGEIIIDFSSNHEKHHLESVPQGILIKS